MSIAVDAGGVAAHVLVDGGRPVSPRFVFKDYDEAVQGPFVEPFMDADGLLPGRLAALLVEDPRGPILVDAGMGPYGEDVDAGHVPDELAALGLDPAAIRVVVITHGHADHVGGLLLEDGSPRFPNARHLIHAAETAFWMSRAAAELPRDAAVAAGRAVPGLRDAGLLDETAEGITVGERVRAIAAPGHTPGHLGVLIGDAFLWAGDAFVAGQNVGHPGWTSAADMDHVRSEATRRELLAMVADGGLILGAVHMVQMGTVARSPAGGFTWTDPV